MLTIISEIGINHNGDERYLQELVRQSAIGGADYAKFQLYSSQRVFGDDSRKRNEFTFEQVQRLHAVCEFYDIEFLASVFDEEKIEWCERLGVKAYKIASRTVTKEPELCKGIISTGKPTIVSLGFWEGEGFPFDGFDNITYLNCISKYPTTCFDYETLRPYNDPLVGLSDHSYGIGYCLYNISHGARVIEKHFTMNKTMEGNDHIGSMDLGELRALREYGNQLASIRRAITS